MLVFGETFDRALKFVLEHEGCFSDDPKDAGGLTRWGISQKNHPDVNVSTLTIEQATEIYKKEYWDVCRCGEMPSALSFVVFDVAVNQGVGVAIRDLQKILGVKVDGVIGPDTLLAISVRSTIGDMITRLTIERSCRYAEASVGKSGYFRGWVKRAVECMAEALGMRYN